MASKFKGEDERQTVGIRALWSCVVSVEEEQRNRSDREAERARYASPPKLVTKYLEKNRSGVGASQTCAAMKVWFCCLAATLSLIENVLSPYSLPKTGKTLLLTACGAETQTAYTDFVVKQKE